MARILFVNYSNDLGGAEKSLLGLLKGLRSRGHAVGLLTFGQGRLSIAAVALGAETFCIEGPGDMSGFSRKGLFRAFLKNPSSLPGFVRTVKRIREVLRRFAPEVVHANNPKSHILTALACRGLGVRLVLHMRDIFPALGSARAVYLLLGLLCRPQVVAISGAVKTALPFSLRRKARVVYNGFDAPVIRRLREPVRRHFFVAETETLILSAGRLVPWKRFDRLVEALAPLLRKGGCRLIIAGEPLYGDPAYAEGLKAQVKKLELSGKVIFAGRVEDMDSLYAASDIFVLASKQEPFGRVLVEAMLCGVTPVAFNEAGPAEIVEHGVTGLLAAPGNFPVLAEAVEKLSRDAGMRDRMGAKAREKVGGRFLMSQAVYEIERSYSETPGNP